MARATKSVSRARTADRGASKKGTGKQAATRGRSAERGAGKRGGAKKGVTRRRGSRAALMVKGWTVNFVSGGSPTRSGFRERRQQRNGDILFTRERRAVRLRRQLQFHYGIE